MLLQQLRAVVKDEREIEFVIAAAAGGSMRAGSGRSVKYFTPSSPPEVYAELWFRRGGITNIQPGQAIQSEKAQAALVERASLETQHTHGSLVATRVQFASLELKGQWMWRNKLRIAPCLPSMIVEGDARAWGSSRARSSTVGPPFAFLLDVMVEKSPNGILEGRRTLWRLDAYQSLLTLFLSPHILFVDYPSDRLWTLEQRDDGVVNVLAQPGFTTGEEGLCDGFQDREAPAAPIYQGRDYYNHLWFQETEIQIPPSLADDLDRFEALAAGAQTNFLRACYWYSLAIQHRSVHAIAHVAFAAAIESLLPDMPIAACTCCNKPIGAGPTQLFANHVKRYGAMPEEVTKQRDALYSVRSALVHGTFAARVDVGHFSAAASIMEESLLMQTVAKRCLINWLRDPERA